jgi:cation diffusion facilitator CzcD-associated flavoprotein CzcO
MCNVTKKYHVGKYMKFSHEIKKATWDEAAGKWKLIVKHGGRTFEDDCDIFINAGGVLK